MSYSVYVQKFAAGEPAFAPYSEVRSILERFGSVDHVEDRIEFVPDGEDLCEIGFVGGDAETGIDSVGFERPVSGGRLAELVFALLGVDGMCYFEADCDSVLARSDVTNNLPEGLLELCSSGSATVISASTQIPL